jgi:hypothetical protein
MKYKKGDKFLIEISNIKEGDLCVYEANGAIYDERILDKMEKYEPLALTAEDAWEIIRKIYLQTYSYRGAYSRDEVLEIFGTDNFNSILLQNTALEASEQIKAWEEKKKGFSVGDIIKAKGSDGMHGVVTGGTLRMIYVLWSDGSTSKEWPERFEKIGEVTGTKEFLEQVFGKNCDE